MKALVSLFLAAALGLAAAPAARAESGPVVVVALHTEISSAQFVFLRRAIKDAESRHASALILDMDTYGGEVSAAVDSMEALMKTQLPTYTYVDSKAISAGALIAMATQKIYMAPTAVIGAAAPVSSEGADLPSTMNAKVVSMMTAMARGAAEKSGHNPDVAEAFVRKEAELKVGGEVLDKSDTLLSLDAKQAVRQFEGKPLLAEGIAPTLEEMVKAAGLSGQIQRVEPTGFERLALFLTAFAPLLLLGGIIGAYLEFKTPGFGLPGIASVVCFTLFFAAHYAAGFAGWEVVFLFALGFLLVCSELFLHPGTVLPGITGVVLMVIALLYAMVDHYPGQSWWPTNTMLMRPLVNLSLALLGATIGIYFLGKYLPRSRLFRWIVLAETTPHGAGLLLPEAAPAVLTGAAGLARTNLRPSGKAEFGGRLLDVVSQGEFVESGQPIRVVAVEGARIVVVSNAAKAREGWIAA